MPGTGHTDTVLQEMTHLEVTTYSRTDVGADGFKIGHLNSVTRDSKAGVSAPFR